MMRPTRQCGFAVITAMLVAGGVASVAAYLAWEASLSVRQLENLQASREVVASRRAAVALALTTVARDDARFDHRGEAWARPMALPDAARVEGHAALADAQARFNLNNLADANGAREEQVLAFRRILAHAGLSPSLADAVVDWLDADDLVTDPAGAEDRHYLAQTLSRLTANRPIEDVAELLLVKGFDVAAVQRLAPYVTALPGTASVNVNTASAALLAALLPALSPGEIRGIVAARDREPFVSKADFAKRLPAKAAEVSNALLEVRTDFFELRGTARAGRAATAYRALIQRDGPSVLALVQEVG
jgi:general secretion pathway protein K